MLVLTNTHMLKKTKNLREQNFKGMVAQPTVTGKELTSGQKQKPQGKKKNLKAKRKTFRQKGKPHGKKKKTQPQKEQPRGKKNNLTAKEIRIKCVLSASTKSCRESFSFCREVFLFAMMFFFLP